MVDSPKKKSDEKALITFHNIIAASVKGNPKRSSKKESR